MAELALDDNQRDTFVRHFDGVGVAQLMRRESPTDAGCRGGVVQLLGADREPAPDLQPRVELCPRPSVHTYLAALASLPASDKDRPASTVEVALMKRERLADS